MGCKFNASTEKIFLLEKYQKKSFSCSEKMGGETEKMNEIITEQIEFTEKMPVDTELVSEQIIDTSEIIDTSSEQIIDTSEIIDTSSEQMNESSEIIPEKISEKRRYRGQRGQDKVPRQLNYNSMMNLKPFKSKAVTIEKETFYWTILMMKLELLESSY